MLRNKITGEVITEREYFKKLFISLKANWNDTVEAIKDELLESDREIDEETLKKLKIEFIEAFANEDTAYEYMSVDETDDLDEEYDEEYEKYMIRAKKELL